MYIVKHQSVINKYMQKAGEPENDAGFLKSDNNFRSACSQLIYGFTKWLLLEATHAPTAIAYNYMC